MRGSNLEVRESQWSPRALQLQSVQPMCLDGFLDVFSQAWVMYPPATILSENIHILDSLVSTILMLHTRFLCTSWRSEFSSKM